MIIFDIEASGLQPESHPIEIAWQDSEDENNYDSFLIRPHEDWTHWDSDAETEIHHISRDQCFETGISITEACDRLNSTLEGLTIYSDALHYDRRWMLDLYECAGKQPTFKFGSVFELVDSIDDIQYSTWIEHEIVKHRALDDARLIIRILKCFSVLKKR